MDVQKILTIAVCMGASAAIGYLLGKSLARPKVIVWDNKMELADGEYLLYPVRKRDGIDTRN